MLSFHKFKRLRTLKSEGQTKCEIASELGIDRKTVSKYWLSNTAPKYPDRRGRTRRDPFLKFEDRTRELLEANDENRATDIYEILREEGYKGSERTVRRRVAEIRGMKAKERFFEQSYDPGEQAQFDFKECVPLPFVDGVRIVHLHFGTLPYSDTCHLKGYPYRVYECFIDGLHSFFETIGGMTKNVRIDNLSPCVKKVLKGNDRIYTTSFQRAIDYYDFSVLPCRPAKGSDKGDVERDIRTHAARIKNLVKNKEIVFLDWESLNQFLSSYMEKRQKEKTQQLFAEEKTFLQPLPKRDEDILCRVEIGQSNGYGTIRINKSAYSIPDELIEVPCKTIMGPYNVLIGRVGNKTDVIHPRKPEGDHSILLNHVLPSLVRKPQAMVRWAHRELLFPSKIFQDYYRDLKKKDSSSAEREYLRVINLIHHVQWEDITAALELYAEMNQPASFETIRELLLGAQVIDLQQRIQQQPLQPRLSQYDSLIPKTGGTNNDS